MRLPRPAAAAPVVAAVMAVGALLAACTAPDAAPEAEPSATGTPLASYDVGAVALERAPYCDRIEATGVVAALDGTAADAEAWENGEQVAVGSGKDRVHEYGCRFVRDDAEAATWLFAPPVPPGRAAALVEDARAPKGCRPAPDAPALGRPSVALLCDGGRTAAYRGLLGDTWLACEVTRDDPPEDLVDVAGRWCVALLEAARIDG